MIFVTVGSQLPFDRLITITDKWAKQNQKTEVIAQIGESKLKPLHLRAYKTMTPKDFNKSMQSADFIVAHAGMGTIITALEMGKPLLVLPRLAKNHEHRNDHQLSTIKRFKDFKSILIAENEIDLLQKMTDMTQVYKDKTFQNENTLPSENLIGSIRNFVASSSKEDADIAHLTARLIKKLQKLCFKPDY
ncbi:MAG: glycosyltransferase [Methylococcaceae bacterium]